MIKIALDAMGGDFAPEAQVKGAELALLEYPDLEIVLVGDEQVLNRLAKKQDRLSIMHAAEKIEMDESPVAAVREKKAASINIALDLHKARMVSAVVSAGNTGAFMTAGLFKLGRLKGIERPAIATVFPSEHGGVLLLDMGANVDCTPNQLKQFGEIGSLKIVDFLKTEIKKSLLAKLGAIMLFPAFKSLKKMVDYDESGGAPLLGLDGICIKAHGRSNPKAIKNAIRVARTACQKQK